MGMATTDTSHVSTSEDYFWLNTLIQVETRKAPTIDDIMNCVELETPART